MSEFQFLKFNKDKQDSGGEDMSREERQEIANKYGIPNTDSITKDSNGNHYHGNELLDDNYLKNHKPDDTSDGPSLKSY